MIFQVFRRLGSALCRGRRLERGGSFSSVLIVFPAAEHPPLAVLDRLAHEYDLKDKIHSAWAARPLELVREGGRTLLILEDPGGEPLERLIGEPIEVETFLRFGIDAAAALSKAHSVGLVHENVEPTNILVNCANGPGQLSDWVSIKTATRATGPRAARSYRRDAGLYGA